MNKWVKSETLILATGAGLLVGLLAPSIATVAVVGGLGYYAVKKLSSKKSPENIQDIDNKE